MCVVLLLTAFNNLLYFIYVLFFDNSRTQPIHRRYRPTSQYEIYSIQLYILRHFNTHPPHPQHKHTLYTSIRLNLTVSYSTSHIYVIFNFQFDSFFLTRSPHSNILMTWSIWFAYVVVDKKNFFCAKDCWFYVKSNIILFVTTTTAKLAPR